MSTTYNGSKPGLTTSNSFHRSISLPATAHPRLPRTVSFQSLSGNDSDREWSSEKLDKLDEKDFAEHLAPVEESRQASPPRPTLDRNESYWQAGPPASLYSTTDVPTSYPEGGLRAWLVVLGSFCGMMAGFGFMNTIGVFQSYLSTNQLKEFNESTIGWIFSVYVFLCFFGGLQIGPIFDKHGPRLLILAGSIMLPVSVLLMGFCTKYWHFMLDVGVLAGVGTSLIFTPSVSSIGHFFLQKRGSATGLAAAGGSVGGVIFPLMLQSLIPKIGFPWATRVMGFILAFLCLVAVLLVRARLPPRPGTSVIPNMKILKEPAFALTTAGVFFMEWGLFIPITYISSYVLETNMEGGQAFAFQILAIFNTGSSLGRYLPGIFADKIGRFNAMIIALSLCTLTTLVFWLPASLLPSSNGVAHPAVKPLSICYALLFGFASGSNISLTPVTIGQLCPTEMYGTYYATAYFLVSFGTLTGIPIAGVLLQVCGGKYIGVIGFTAGCYVMAFSCYLFARARKVGWKVKGEHGWILF